MAGWETMTTTLMTMVQPETDDDETTVFAADHSAASRQLIQRQDCIQPAVVTADDETEIVVVVLVLVLVAIVSLERPLMRLPLALFLFQAAETFARIPKMEVTGTLDAAGSLEMHPAAAAAAAAASSFHNQQQVHMHVVVMMMNLD